MLKNEVGFWRRLLNTMRYSLKGLHSAWKSEAAFRQELVVVVPLLVVALVLDVTATQRTLLIIVTLGILIVELLNSAVEAVVDRVGPERHPLAEQAKNMGSAAVLLSLIAAGVVWGAALWDKYYR